MHQSSSKERINSQHMVTYHQSSSACQQILTPWSFYKSHPYRSITEFGFFDSPWMCQAFFFKTFPLGAHPSWNSLHLNICLTNSQSFSALCLCLTFSGRPAFIILFNTKVYSLLHLQGHLKSFNMMNKFIIIMYYLSFHISI